MSLLVWEFFLDEADWVTAPPIVPSVPAGQPNAGGGHKKRYTSPDPDFWLARERYLQRFLPQIAAAQLTPAKIAKAPVEEHDRLRMLSHAQAAIALRAQNAENEAQFRDSISRFKQLSLDIEQVFDDYYAQAAIILLLDLF
jgi:hypothetical protein